MSTTHRTEAALDDARKRCGITSSEMFLHEAALAMAAQNKPVYIYYLGDYDPTGAHIPQKIEKRLRELASHTEIHFARIAITHEPIREGNLPTRPPKEKDSRSKKSGIAVCVELDAGPTDKLIALERSKIEPHIDPELVRRTREIEATERESLATILAGLRPAA
jgi:hypothetical protein